MTPQLLACCRSICLLSCTLTCTINIHISASKGFQVYSNSQISEIWSLVWTFTKDKSSDFNFHKMCENHLRLPKSTRANQIWSKVAFVYEFCCVIVQCYAMLGNCIQWDIIQNGGGWIWECFKYFNVTLLYNWTINFLHSFTSHNIHITWRD